MVYSFSDNPYQHPSRKTVNAIFTFTISGLFVIDFDTGNFSPSEPQTILCSASVEQAKEPNLTIQSGLDYSRIYFVGHLINPKIFEPARQSQSVIAVINGIEGKFDFIPVFDSATAQNIQANEILGQQIAGYFTSSGTLVSIPPNHEILIFTTTNYFINEY